MADMITGTDFICIGCTDFDRARAFYGETLGLREGLRWGSMPGMEFETGNLTIAVMQSDAFGVEFAPHKHPVTFHVEDFEGARASLESRGVTVRPTIDSGVCWQAHFSDPDGNQLGIHHRYEPR